FGLFLGIEPLEMAFAALPQLRRTVNRAASPQLSIELRICVGRAEARRESPLEAQKHLAVAEELVGSFPNLWLEGLICLDKSTICGLMGDLESSESFAREAVRLATMSGHFRTRVAAVINLSHVLCWRGNFDAAEDQVRQAILSAGQNLHLSLAAL